jgi:tetratricopeptide (TPR) repeat protein
MNDTAHKDNAGSAPVEDARLSSLSTEALVCVDRADFDGAMNKFKECYRIGIETNNQGAVAAALNNMGHVYVCKRDDANAFVKYNEALKTALEAGDLVETARSYHNLGTYYERGRDFKKALSNLFNSLAVMNRASVEAKTTLESISTMRSNLRFSTFREVALEAFDEVVPELKEHVGIDALTADKTVRHDFEKAGRNDPCTCGSGKKFKKCCGA